MIVHIATDHAAFELKQYLVTELTALGHEVIDHGASTYDAEDDYPVFVLPCAEAVAADPASLGIVLGGSGNGEQMAANKVTGIRAALASNTVLARLAREHNDANVLSLGGRMQSHQEALDIARSFLETPFSTSPRHQRRVGQIAAYEAGRH
ncbi:MAG: ribose-5-phosphate isomerase [Propioniciclava sp.]